MRISILTVWGLLILNACATTKMESTLGPGVQGRRFERVLVLVPLRPAESRELVETTFAEKSRPGTVFIPSYSVIDLGVDYSDREITEILETNEVDAVLRLTLTVQGYKTGVVCCIGYTSATVENPTAGFELQLIDTESGEVVWSSTATTLGNAFADGDDLLRSVARKAVSQLARDGLVY